MSKYFQDSIRQHFEGKVNRESGKPLASLCGLITLLLGCFYAPNSLNIPLSEIRKATEQTLNNKWPKLNLTKEVCKQFSESCGSFQFRK